MVGSDHGSAGTRGTRSDAAARFDVLRYLDVETEVRLYRIQHRTQRNTRDILFGISRQSKIVRVRNSDHGIVDLAYCDLVERLRQSEAEAVEAAYDV